MQIVLKRQILHDIVLPPVIPISRTPALSPLEYEQHYRLIRPVVIEGGGRQLPACTLWTMEHLRQRVGTAQVDTFQYRGARGDYDNSVPVSTSMSAFIDALVERADPSYLFPSQTAVFARNERRPERHVGWATSVNSGLAPLSEEFTLPGFVRPDDYVLASLILGSAQNATDLHYDLGGESKLLIQIAGRKRIRLVPPSEAPLLELHGAFAPGDEESPRRRNRSRGEADLDSAALREHSYETVLLPGDIIYWPAFWSHEVSNLDTPTFAASVFLDEIRLNPLLVRHMLVHTFHSFLRLIQVQLSGQPLSQAEQAQLDITFKDIPFVSLLDLFSELESFMLSRHCVGVDGLWTWNWTLPTPTAP